MTTSTTDHRFWLLELITYWEGRVNAGHLRSQFGLSRQQASKIINQYKQAHPNNLTYSSTRKGYLPSPRLTARYISGDAIEYKACSSIGRSG